MLMATPGFCHILLYELIIIITPPIPLLLLPHKIFRPRPSKRLRNQADTNNNEHRTDSSSIEAGWLTNCTNNRPSKEP